MDLVPLTPGALIGRILLVDADLISQSQTGHRLTQHGAHVSSFETGEDAVNELLLLRANQQLPAAIILDTALPGISGSLCIRELRRTGYNGPIIAYTSQERAGDREVCLRSGCDRWLPKSAGMNELLSCLRAFLTTRENRRHQPLQQMIDEYHWPVISVSDDLPYDYHLQELMAEHGFCPLPASPDPQPVSCSPADAHITAATPTASENTLRISDDDVRPTDFGLTLEDLYPLPPQAQSDSRCSARS